MVDAGGSGAGGGTVPPPFEGAASSQPWSVKPRPPEAGRPSRRWAPLALLGAATLVVGFGIGFLVRGGAVSEQRERAVAAEAASAALSADLEEATKQLNDRDAQRAADQAAATRAEQERQRDKERREAAEEEQRRREAEEAAAAQAAAQAAAEEEARRAAEEAAAQASRRTVVPPGDGIYAIGEDIDPGTWRTQGGAGSCYYAILSSVDGSFGSIDDNNITEGPAIVSLSSGKYFEVRGCAEWRRQ